VLVAELLDLAQRMTNADRARLVIDHPLQPFSARYGQPDGLLSYAQEWFAAGTPAPPFSGHAAGHAATASGLDAG